jgi:hypothetical protein
VVFGGFARRDRGLTYLEEALGCLRFLQDIDLRELDPSEPFGMGISGLAREPHAFVERSASPRQLVGFLQRLAEMDPDKAARGFAGNELDRPSEQVHRGSDVLSRPGGARGG